MKYHFEFISAYKEERDYSCEPKDGKGESFRLHVMNGEAYLSGGEVPSKELLDQFNDWRLERYERAVKYLWDKYQETIEPFKVIKPISK